MEAMTKTTPNGHATGNSKANGNGKAIYDESKIKTLSSLEHIRLRTGMYIGRLGSGSDLDDGIYILLKEIVDNSVDEFIMGHGNKVDITIDEDLVKVRDYGRGIPLGKSVECVSVINTGAKYNDDVFQFSVGLNGVGTGESDSRSPRRAGGVLGAGEGVRRIGDEVRWTARRPSPNASIAGSSGDALRICAELGR